MMQVLIVDKVLVYELKKSIMHRIGNHQMYKFNLVLLSKIHIHANLCRFPTHTKALALCELFIDIHNIIVDRCDVKEKNGSK